MEEGVKLMEIGVVDSHRMAGIDYKTELCSFIQCVKKITEQEAEQQVKFLYSYELTYGVKWYEI